MTYRVALCVVVLLSSFVLADNPYPTSITPAAWTPGTVGNGTIFYQSQDLFTFPNVQNPVTVSITYSSGSNFPAEMCLNSMSASLPVSGVFLQSSCPSGAYGTVSNNTMESGAVFSSTPDDATDDTVTAEVYVKPSSEGGFIVSLPDAEAIQDFSIRYKGNACQDPQFPVGSNGQCIEIDDMAAQQMVKIGAGTWKFLRLTLPTYTVGNNNYTVSVNGTSNGISMYIQQGYIPSENWYINTDNNNDDKDITRATILTPGGFSGGEVYYVGIYNANDGTRSVSVNGTVGACTGTLFGYNCQHDSTNTTGAVGGYRTFPATLTQSNEFSPTVNNGSSLSYDFSDDDTYEHEYAYFKITDYPDYGPNTYYIRVTAANNDVSDLSGAPPLFAKLGGYPSAQSNHYNMSTTGDVAHQLTLPITSATYNNGTSTEATTWYVAVQLPADFSIWVGVNCADRCDNNDHGSCYCNQVTCDSATTNQTTALNVYYTRPSYLQDSAGACTCDSKKYDNSFDCSEKNNGNTAIYIVLIAIGGFLVLAAAIAAPVYCWYSSKKTKGYQEM